MDSAGTGEERVRVTAVAYEHGPTVLTLTVDRVRTNDG